MPRSTSLQKSAAAAVGHQANGAPAPEPAPKPAKRRAPVSAAPAPGLDDGAAPLTNVERRDDVLFLLDLLAANGLTVPAVLDAAECDEFRRGDPEHQQRLFYRLLCFGALAAQPAPEAVVLADWRRFTAAGVIDAVFDGSFDVRAFASSPPVSRADSRGRVIDFVRLAAARESWATLLPRPTDDTAVVDLLYACSGGALKSRAFWVVREMLRHGLWPADGLRRSACMPDGRLRKRASRMGLVDLPEHADTIDDMKAFAAALHAVFGLAGKSARESYDLPLTSGGAPRCEICDHQRMAVCPIPHCRFRRIALGSGATHG